MYLILLAAEIMPRLSSRRKKRAFCGNQHKTELQHSLNADISATSHSEATASSMKLSPIGSLEVPMGENTDGFRLVSLPLLNDFICSLLCPACKTTNLQLKDEKHIGCASTLSYSCSCGWIKSFDTSGKKDGRMEVNNRITQAFQSIGKNRTDAESFAVSLNMPPPLSRNAWKDSSALVAASMKRVAEASMSKAAEDMKADGSTAVTVSVDGTWQKRGFSSKNGVVTCVGVSPDLCSKVLDTEVLTTYCQACASKSAQLSCADFEEWKTGHGASCVANHNGSSGAMEPKGALAIFRRSEEKHGLVYEGYLGDGDSKSYTAVKTAEPPIYNNVNIEKKECVGHIQKRLHNYAQKLVGDCKNKKYNQGQGKTTKGIGGKGKLTKGAISSLQGHYGAAIRKNKGNLQGMKQDVWSIYFHRSGEHGMCGPWCTKDDKADSHKLPSFVMEELKPTFRKLADPNLLKKCLHGGTQNTNEAFHHVIWTKCLKGVFVGRNRLEAAVYEATIQYNDGELGKAPVFQDIHGHVGVHTARGLAMRDRARVARAEVAASLKSKGDRKRKSQVNKDLEDYNPGGF